MDFKEICYKYKGEFYVSINLSILDFKVQIWAAWHRWRNTINLSILDFKGLILYDLYAWWVSINLSILDFKVVYVICSESMP